MAWSFELTQGEQPGAYLRSFQAIARSRPCRVRRQRSQCPWLSCMCCSCLRVILPIPTAAKIEATRNRSPRAPNALFLVGIPIPLLHNPPNSFVITRTPAQATVPGKGSCWIASNIDPLFHPSSIRSWTSICLKPWRNAWSEVVHAQMQSWLIPACKSTNAAERI